MKRIVLCADDYGQALPISRGILDLIEQKRLSATSCLVNAADWLQQAENLRPYESSIDIGLHFNLTHGEPLSSAFKAKYGNSFFTLGSLIKRSLFGQLEQKVIEAECNAQIDRFEAGLQFLPYFLDGHQHVHQFPIVRDAVMQVFLKRLKPAGAYMRWVNDEHKGMDVKKWVIHALGTRALKKDLMTHGILHNPSFSGIYGFDAKDGYQRYFQRFLEEVGDQGIIMCHPGHFDSNLDDSIGKARNKEYEYFMSPAFLDDLNAQKVQLIHQHKAHKD